MYPVYPYYAREKKCREENLSFPPQHQDCQPGMEYVMKPLPIYDYDGYCAAGKLKGKTAIVTGGDSGIGRACAVAYAKEGADLVIVYLNEEKDAMEAKCCIEKYGGKCILVQGDLRNPKMSKFIVEKTLSCFGKIDILVNNCGVQFVQDSILDISNEQLAATFETNVYSFFYLTKAVLPHLKEGDAIINTTSVTAYRGQKNMIDYSSTKGAIVTFTRSLSLSLAEKGIRVNGVAPGPIWTPLQPASYDAVDIPEFGMNVPMERPGQPFELAPIYVYLACDDSRYVSGQILHVNGGEMVGS